ncbi:hypothetical protein SAMN04489729_4797 [Amycolatopsis lurida]|uniref:Uncharacterized protein n=1 Tax=Amycolatopsis lurida NRRL 2430 TaxID=1460371 RepID=A0A2P2FWA9_AMYLU|nr:hypothetical protein [Amycolatopsis lurida]KFU81027.1 hypothetical protein BB31_11640 [Amycolatopsis lurida NRRL 2430]SED59866.1 hypothetical protein SAMN04489729_4797 [Amycolatopsis lurida]
MTAPYDVGSYEHFLAEVGAGRVWVMGLGAGAGSAEILVGKGGTNAVEFTDRGYLYRALEDGDVRIHGVRVTLARPMAGRGGMPSPA